jgi:hypothetical protein
MELKTSKELTMRRIALLLPALATLSLVAVYAAPAKADTMAKPVTKHHHHHHQPPEAHDEARDGEAG